MPFVPFSIILRLRRELAGTNAEILTWGCDGYNDRIKQWSESCDKIVGAVVLVASVDESAAVVNFATCHQIPFAVRGGGYSTTGSSIARGGIVLDLSRLRKVHVDAVTRVVTAQGGVLWKDVDIAAAQYGLAVVGSTLNNIGAAGATLGGGYGWLTGQYGLTIDNLLWARMILADGSILTASESQFPDLFWAIRGAGQSFGVAIELGFRAHKQPHPVFAGTLFFSVDDLATIVEFANHFENINDGKQGLWFGFVKPPSDDRCSILVAVFYNGNRTAAEQFFSPLFELGPTMNNTQMMPYDSVNGMLNSMDLVTRRGSLHGIDITLPIDEKIGHRKSLRGSNIALPLHLDFVLSIYQRFDNILKDFPQVRDSVLLFELLPNSIITKVANNATAFASRGPYYNTTSLFRWHDAHLDGIIHSLQKSLMDDIGASAGIARQPDYTISKHGTGLYANYAGNDVPMEALFGDNLQRLRELKKVYDPFNTFRNWHNINANFCVPE